MGIEMGLSDLSDSALKVLTAMAQNLCTLYQIRTNNETQDQFYVSLDYTDATQTSPRNAVALQVFEELWEEGYLYLEKTIRQDDGEVRCFLLTGIARATWSIKTSSVEKMSLNGNWFEILRLMAEGRELSVTEFNGPTAVWKIRFNGKQVRSTVVLAFLKQNWVQAIGRPQNIRRDLRTWQWSFCISQHGQAVVNERLDVKRGKRELRGQAVTGDEVKELSQKLATVLVDELNPNQVQNRTSQFFNQLFRQIRQEYWRIRREREESAKACIEAVERWASDQGYIVTEEAQQWLRLSEKEFQAAERLKIIDCINVPLLAAQEPVRRYLAKYYDPAMLQISQADRKRISHETLLTSFEAAQLLGVSVKNFYQLKRTIGLEPVGMYAGRGLGGPGYLYRLSDIEKFRRSTDSLETI
jgi:hypothetical protein